MRLATKCLFRKLTINVYSWIIIALQTFTEFETRIKRIRNYRTVHMCPLGRGSRNSKSGSRDPHMTPFDLILHFFVSTHCYP